MKSLRQLFTFGLLIAAGSYAYGITDYERRIVAAVLTLEAGNQQEEGMRAVFFQET